MREHARELVAAAAQALAGKAHTEDELHTELFQLALDIVSPSRSSDAARPGRRMPLANEVLPRHQRATWARGKTVHDAEET
jgi:hypothetical protein